MRIVKIENQEINFEAVVNLMDDQITEDLHAKLAPCSDQDFLDAYLVAHAEKFDEEFEV